MGSTTSPPYTAPVRRRAAALAGEEGSEPAGVEAYSLDKRYHGGVEGTARGEMLGTRDDAAGWAVYVAIERVTGTLDGHGGSFLLVHQGTMLGDSGELTVTIAPGSGTGELTGITGTMEIDLEGGRHDYELEYVLADGS